MKFFCVVLMTVLLLASCTTVEGIESPEGLEIDKVKGSEVTQ